MILRAEILFSTDGGKMSINIKMEKDRLILRLDSDRAFSEQKNEIKEYLKRMSSFFGRGEAKIGYEGLSLGFFEEAELCGLIEEAFEREVNFSYKAPPPQKLMRQILADGERLSKSIKRTIRGGEKVTSNGDLIILGDVNPASEAEATGDIYVLGRLRGCAHAGAGGDLKAVVFALEMEPEQISIAGVTAFNTGIRSENPCRAELRNNEIFITNL